MNEAGEQQTTIQKFKTVLTDPTFVKPLLTCIALRVLGLDWGGYFDTGSHMVLIIKECDLALEPYSLAAGLSLLRVPIIFSTFFFINRQVPQSPILLQLIR